MEFLCAIKNDGEQAGVGAKTAFMLLQEGRGARSIHPYPRPGESAALVWGPLLPVYVKPRCGAKLGRTRDMDFRQLGGYWHPAQVDCMG